MTINYYEKLFIYLYITSINLHLLRNIIPLYEIIILIILFLCVICFLPKFKFNSQDKILWLWVLIIFGIIYIILITFFQKNIWNQYIPLDQILVGTSRIILMPLTMLILFPAVYDDKLINGIINIFIIVSLLSVLSLIYQYYMGSISWFADPGSQRGNNIRYASLHGSKTVSSTSLSIAILCTYFTQKNLIIKIVSISLLFVGLILILQKSSIVNVVLILLLIFLFSKHKFLNLFYIIIGSLISYYLFNILKEINSEMIVISHLDSILNFSLDTGKYDSLNQENFAFRFYGGAINMMNEYGWSIPFSGIGLMGAGASMGVDGGQAHNTFWDLIFMGSIIFLMFFVISLFIIFHRNLLIGGKFSKLFITSNILFITNCMQGSILFFQPVTSIIFWLSMAYSSKLFISRIETLKT